jgi:hypothetical protein
VVVVVEVEVVVVVVVVDVVPEVVAEVVETDVVETSQATSKKANATKKKNEKIFFMANLNICNLTDNLIIIERNSFVKKAFTEFF